MFYFRCDNCKKEIKYGEKNRSFTISATPPTTLPGANDRGWMKAVGTSLTIEDGLRAYGGHVCSLFCLGELVQSYVL